MTIQYCLEIFLITLSTFLTYQLKHKNLLKLIETIKHPDKKTTDKNHVSSYKQKSGTRKTKLNQKRTREYALAPGKAKAGLNQK